MKKQREMMPVLEDLLNLHPTWSASQIAAEASRVIAEPASRKKPARLSRLKRKYG
jgi:hypothetical protein